MPTYVIVIGGGMASSARPWPTTYPILACQSRPNVLLPPREGSIAHMACDAAAGLVNTHLWLDVYVLHLHTHAMRQYTPAHVLLEEKKQDGAELWLQQLHVCGVYRIGM